MYQLTLILLFVARVKPEPKSFQHEYYVSRQSRDNAVPTQTGYVFSRMDNKPATFQSLANSGASAAITDGTVKVHSDIGNIKQVQSGESDQYRKSLMGKLTDMPTIHRNPPFKMITSVENIMFTGATESIPYATKSWGHHSIDYEIAKAKSKLGLHPAMPINTDKEYMRDEMAKIEHKYSAPADTTADIKPVYDFNREFHIDDDDVKTLSGTTLEWWPYFMHSPYEYESIKMDSNIQKAKEKRYAIASAERIIPVHEREEDYSHVYGPRHIEPQYDSQGITSRGHSPESGNEGFVSFVLKDFGNNYDSDPLELNFKSAFDTNDNIGQNTGKRNRRLDDLSHLNDQHDTGTKIDASRAALGDSNHEKGYEKKHEFDKHESGNSKNNIHNTNRAQSENNESAFKDVVDQFANRFGGEDHNRHSAFTFKRNSDNGEKKKGFRRVYHKDEYQEDNEFYDNTNNSAKAEDSGSSTVHSGGSIAAAVQSHAAAAAGNKANAFNEIENTKKNQFENNHKGHDAKKGLDRDFNRYRDVVQKTSDRDYVPLYP